MSNLKMGERLEEVLTNRGYFPEDTVFEKVDRDSVDQLCDVLEINVLEKAYIVGLDPQLIFNSSFIKSISFLGLNRNEDRFAIWKNILGLE